MLYNYPPEATNGNWLHWCLAQTLMQVHRELDLKKTLPKWPLIIPDEYREKLKLKHGLRDKLKTYTNALKGLSDAERQRVLETLVSQNQIRRVLCGRRSCKRIDSLPETIREPAKDLFTCAFGLLTSLEIRDSHYQTIYKRSDAKLCPFCGLEYFDAPGAPREDDDHYLPKSQYPFAAANLWNLVPMGHKCNSRYKGTADPLMTGGGIRRKVLNPYGAQCFTISLIGTVPLGPPDGITPSWQIAFLPSFEEATTWEELFDLSTRYRRDVLDPHWQKWLEEFGAFAREKDVTDEASLRDALASYCRIMRAWGLSDRAFLKSAYFDVILDEFNKQNGHIIGLLSRITYDR
ncbi:MAG: hypothetical protein JWP89_3372 [Schlesneria sp.]|nr:hypothetical protein [Schlesneria sp.]